MGDFVQLHLLTSYPPANLNRDDLGRPKTAIMGGVQRLRASSQSLKRAWRTSSVFKEALAGHLGTRTREMGREILQKLVAGGMAEGKARKVARAIAGVFGKLKGNDSVDIEQLAHFSPEEIETIDTLVETLANENREPEKNELNLLREKHKAADIALFGRMLAAAPSYNTDAAVQVAHAITVHKVAVEDDFFTAVDDLNRGVEDVGAGHMGETEFAAGLFYLYVCIDRGLLLENLDNDKELAGKTIAALVEAAATIAPTGKQNSFASRARASYILCEKGTAQPRSLSVAFLKPVSGIDMLTESIDRLRTTMENMDKAYGKCAEKRVEMNAHTGEGSLKEVIACAATFGG